MRQGMWPKAPYWWFEAGLTHVSVPFTWNLPRVRDQIRLLHSHNVLVRVGGPAVDLMPDYFAEISNVQVGGPCPGALQKVNPLATRTTEGCPNKCRFCAIGTGKIWGGKFRELADWPGLPVVCDDNLLAASDDHFNRVIDRLKTIHRVDFNQGLDARRLTRERAIRLAELPGAMIRLSCDSNRLLPLWATAREHLIHAGVARSRIRTYCLIGWEDSPADAWGRCNAIEACCGGTCLPQWFHELDAGRAGTPRKIQHAMECAADSADSAFPLWAVERLKSVTRTLKGDDEQKRMEFHCD